jgi:hypothetical protein
MRKQCSPNVFSGKKIKSKEDFLLFYKLYVCFFSSGKKKKYLEQKK